MYIIFIPKNIRGISKEIYHRCYCIGITFVKRYYCIKPMLPVRYKHVLTEENRALTG